MTKYGKRKIEALLAQGRVALNNARDTPEMLALLVSFNYDEARLQEGQVLFQDLRKQHEAQLRLRAQQKEATAAFNAAREDANKTYRRHVKISRALLSEEPERLARLGLEGQRAKPFGAWQEQARQFYREGLADAELQALLAEGGLLQEVLDSGRAQVKAAVQARDAQESASGLAQQSTKDRDAAAETFQQWMRKFWKIAEVALSDQPQWLERLGRKVRCRRGCWRRPAFCAAPACAPPGPPFCRGGRRSTGAVLTPHPNSVGERHISFNSALPLC